MPSGPSHRPPAWPIVVAGGGPTGLAFALAAATALGPAVAVAVCDPGLGRTAPPGRAYALSPAAVGMLRTLGVWSEIARSAQPITAMTITDGRVSDVVRPSLLTFGDGSEALAHMVEDAVLTPALAAACRAAGVALLGSGVAGFDAGAARTAIRLADGTGRPAALLVAADGARSRIRALADIPWYGRPYGQSGLVAAIRHERDHEGRAMQHFLPGGPFATLPLRPGADGRHRSAIVWTERDAAVPALLGGSAETQREAVARRAGPALGAIALDGPLTGYPLALGLARRLVGPRLALLGDAAHQIHPLAGLGLNLGLADAAALAERVADRVRLGLDPGAPDALDEYERDRRGDAVALAAATDALNRLFSNDAVPLRVLRDIGLGLVDRLPAAKAGFSRQASGMSARAPRLMRGESI